MLSLYQFGFRKNHETTHSLMEVIDYIYKSLDEGNCVFGIYINFKRAFNTLQHQILLQKLQHYGMQGIALEWFYSYLSNKKKQFIVTNSIQSDILELSGYINTLPHQFLSELDNVYDNNPERSWNASFQHWYCQNGVRYFSTKFLMRATNVTMTVFRSF